MVTYIKDNILSEEWVDKPTLFYVFRSDVMKKNDVCETVSQIVTPIAEKNGCEIYDIEFKKEGSEYFLRVYIDVADEDRSASLNECEAISRELSEALDKADPIEQAYMLEVSTPGIDRHLNKEAHFKRYIGSKVDIGLYKALNGSKRITAVLKNFENGVMTMETPDGDFQINLSETTSVRLSLEGIF